MLLLASLSNRLIDLVLNLRMGLVKTRCSDWYSNVFFSPLSVVFSVRKCRESCGAGVGSKFSYQVTVFARIFLKKILLEDWNLRLSNSTDMTEHSNHQI